MFCAMFCSVGEFEGAHDGEVFLYLLFGSYLLGEKML